MSKTFETLGKRARCGIQYAVLLAAASGLARAAWPVPTAGCGSANAYIKLWQIKGTADGDLCFVGDAPTGSATANIQMLIVPVKVELVEKNGNVIVLDPTQPLSVPVNSITGFNALDAVLASPIFENHDWKAGPVDLGSSQWGEAVEKASFLNYPGTSFSNWHVQLVGDVLFSETPTIVVPVGAWTKSTTIPGAYQVDQAALKPSLVGFAATFGAAYPNKVPILLTYNVEKINGSSCCARGYHAHTTDAHGYTIPYIWASYMDAYSSSPNPDLDALSHEVAEFMHNPLNSNKVKPAWPKTSGKCDSAFEVGDPIETLSPIIRLFSITMPAMTYNFQNVVTASWLMRAAPAFSANAQYAFPNKPDSEFAAPAKTCTAP